MRNPSVRSLVKQRVMTFEPPGDVVGVQDGSLRGGEQAVATHHRDVGLWNRQDARRAEWRGADRADLCGPIRQFRMTGKKRRKMPFDPDWPHAGTAAAVG